MSDFLTWRELRARLLQETNDRVLDEPVLFGYLDAYGTMYAYPVELLREFPQPNSQRTLVGDDDGEYELIIHPEYDDRTPLRRLPPDGLLLHYSDMDENVDERNQWLTQANPHTPIPPDPAPGPAPLFE